MKHLRIAFLLVVLICTAEAKMYAHDIEAKNSDGVTIYYNIKNDMEVGVTYPATYNGHHIYGYYKNNLEIPASITYDGKLYKVTSIEGETFCDCPELTSVSLPNSISFIGLYAFRNCNGLNAIRISDIAAWCKIRFVQTSIPPYKLYLDDKELVDLVIPEGVTSISSGAFWNCKSIKTIVFPSSVTSVEGWGFASCSNLQSVSFSNSLSSIGPSCFLNCTSLESIVIPNSVSSIGEDCFDRCSNLVSVVLPENLKSIPKTIFYKCSNLKSVSIPNSVEIIEETAFAGCKSLTSITIPDNVSTIKFGAFYGCIKLERVFLGENTSLLDEFAFAECDNLKEVSCYSKSVPQTGNKPFLYCPLENATLYVLDNLVNEYKTTEPWSEFGTIKGVSTAGIHPIVTEPESVEIYDVLGNMHNSLHRGINIIRNKNGQAKKVIVK